MPAKIYSDKDADLNVLKGKTMAVIGFGSQGHAHALNLKESGVNVIIGLYPGSKSQFRRPRNSAFKVFNAAEAVKKADVILVAVPDLLIASVYEKDTQAEPDQAARHSFFSHSFCDPFQDGETAEGHRRDHGRAEGAGPSRASSV